MDADKSLALLGDQMTELYHRWVFSPDSTSNAAREQIRARAAELAEEALRLKAESLAALRVLINQQASMPEDERIDALVRGFEFGSKLAHALYDEIRDVDGHNEVVLLKNSIAHALDAIGAGRRAALVPLLEHPDPRVRASAGAYLLTRMPDRVLPVLREVEEHEHANSAHFSAYFARRGWELDGK